jgi:hypothetical protein
MLVTENVGLIDVSPLQYVTHHIKLSFMYNQYFYMYQPKFWSGCRYKNKNRLCKGPSQNSSYAKKEETVCSRGGGPRQDTLNFIFQAKQGKLMSK